MGDTYSLKSPKNDSFYNKFNATILSMNLNEETRIKKQGFKYVIGLDEAGRGALAGPVVASAIYYKGKNPIQGVKDSKNKPKQKKKLSLKINKPPLCFMGYWDCPI